MAKDVASEIMKYVDNDAWELRRMYSIMKKDPLSNIKFNIRAKIKKGISEGYNSYILNSSEFEFIGIRMGSLYYIDENAKNNLIIIVEYETTIYYFEKTKEDIYTYITEELNVKIKLKGNRLALDWSHWSD